jgi:nucleotide-binding universal stress UspA family protein
MSQVATQLLTTSKIIACLDDSAYLEGICKLSQWAAERSNSAIALLHVAEPHSEMEAKGNLSGSIGLGAKSDLLKELTEIDEEHGKIEQAKGCKILNRAKDLLSDQNTETLHRRGTLEESVADFEDSADLIILGKQGESEVKHPEHIGEHIENVARASHTPVIVTTKSPSDIKRILIAYDGGKSAKKIIDYVASTPLLKGTECHLLSVQAEANKLSLSEEEQTLTQAGYKVTTAIQTGTPKEVIKGYITQNNIDLLIIGAYSHSKIRSVFFGSTTTELIQSSTAPVLLIR